MALATTHYRFGINELAENTHGWHAAEDTDPAAGAIPVDTTFLLRFNVQATGGVAHNNIDFQFQCAKNGGAFQNITTTSSICKAVAATPLTEGGHCTKRLSGTGTFESSGSGQTVDGLSGGNNNDIVANGCSETECGLQLVGADLVAGDVITFQLTSPDLTITNSVTPTLAMPAPARPDDGPFTQPLAGRRQTGQRYGTFTRTDLQERDATAAGTSAASGAAAEVKARTGTADGIGQATGAPGTTEARGASSAGTGAASGASADVEARQGTSGGQAEAQGEAEADIYESRDATAEGTATAQAESAQVEGREGSAAGAGDADAESGAIEGRQGTSTGAGTATGDGVDAAERAYTQPLSGRRQVGRRYGDFTRAPEPSRPDDGPFTQPFGMGEGGPGRRYGDFTREASPVEERDATAIGQAAVTGISAQLQGRIGSVVASAIASAQASSILARTITSAGQAVAAGNISAFEGRIATSSGQAVALAQDAELKARQATSQAAAEGLADLAVILARIATSAGQATVAAQNAAIRVTDAIAAGQATVSGQVEDVGADGVEGQATGQATVVGVSGQIQGQLATAVGNAVAAAERAALLARQAEAQASSIATVIAAQIQGREGISLAAAEVLIQAAFIRMVEGAAAGSATATGYAEAAGLARFYLVAEVDAFLADTVSGEAMLSDLLTAELVVVVE